MADFSGFSWVDFRRRWRPESVICLCSCIPAIFCTYTALRYFREVSVLSHVTAIAVTLMAVVIQVYVLPPRLSEVSIRSFLLGHVAGLGLFVATSGRPEWMFGAYLVFLAWFHWSEYLFASLYCVHSCSKKSFILYHSPAYIVATLVSWVEFFAVQFLWPGFRSFLSISLLGLLMCLVGESLRKVAIATAAESFNHVVEASKRKEHRLITDGIYAWCRHPSYLGWWLFAVGTQILLQNPICAIAYFFGARHFFADRIEYEEELLVSFFGNRYRDYRRRVPLRLPFIEDPAVHDK